MDHSQKFIDAYCWSEQDCGFVFKLAEQFSLQRYNIFTDQRKTEWTPSFYLEGFWWRVLLVTNEFLIRQTEKHPNILWTQIHPVAQREIRKFNKKKTWNSQWIFLELISWSLCCIMNTNQVFLESATTMLMTWWKGIGRTLINIFSKAQKVFNISYVVIF